MTVKVEYVDVARAAWEQLPNGTHEAFMGQRVVKLPKYVIVMPTR